jgi:hypothetical protein
LQRGVLTFALIWMSTFAVDPAAAQRQAGFGPGARIPMANSATAPTQIATRRFCCRSLGHRGGSRWITTRHAYARARKKRNTSATGTQRRKLTSRQQAFLRYRTTPPYCSSARAARLAGYSESVARKADHIIGSSPAVREALQTWKETTAGETALGWTTG